MGKDGRRLERERDGRRRERDSLRKESRRWERDTALEKDCRRREKLRRIVGTSRGDGGERPTTIVDIPDELLELILLCVRTPVCLFRAAATCRLWRRVIAGDGFLRRLRSRHGHGSHLLFGHYSVNTEPWTGTVTNTEFVPLPPQPAKNRRQRFSLDFLPRPNDHPYSRPVLTDSRSGLLAFVRETRYAIVCDPYTRKYREIHIRWAERPLDPPTNEFFHSCIGVFLLDADNDNSSSPLSSFSLLCACIVEDDFETMTVESCVFSARDNCWRRRRIEDVPWRLWDIWSMNMYDRFVGRAGGSIFSASGNHVLSLDESTGEFSYFELPPLAPPVHRKYHTEDLRLRVVAGEGAQGVRIVRMVDDGILEVLTANHGGWEFTVKSRVGLCQLANLPGRSWCFVDTDTRATLVLRAFSSSSTSALLFSLDVENMMLQPANNMTVLYARRVFPYELPWPQTI